MKMRKLLALVLCLCLVLPLCSAAFATGNEGELNTDPTATPVAENPPAETPVPPAETPVPPAVDDPEPDACTCGAEEGAAHAADCPLNTAPGAASPSPTADPAEPTPAADPAEPTPAVSCTCDATDEEKAAEGFLHAEGCPLCVDTTAFDVDAAYAAVMDMQSLQELEAYAATLTEEQQQAVAKRLSEADVKTLAERFGISLEETVIIPPKNYTRVGPLMPPVSVQAARRMLRAAAQQEEEENGLILSKTATPDDDGNYTITMEAYTTGTVTSSDKSIPTDIVLVLDESGSMEHFMYSYKEVYPGIDDRDKTYYVKSDNSYVEVNWCSGGFFSGHDEGWYTGFHFIVHEGTKYEPMTSATDTTEGHVQFYEQSGQTKKQALVAAAKGFVEKVYQDAVANDVDHRISVIGFSDDGNASTKVGLVADIRDNRDNVNTAIDRLRTNGGTYIEDGMQLAEDAFKNAAPTTATERNRIVIVFTDGIPGTGSWYNSMKSANSAIATSKTLKSTGAGGYGATVYVIGLLDGADPSMEIIPENADGGKEDTARTNRFLHYLSSNYPNAESMENGGSGGNNGYYLSASDTSSLETIFKKIADEIQTPTIDLGSETVVKDIISPYFTLFTLPAETPVESIKLFTEDYNGTAFVGKRVPLTGANVVVEGDQVSVTGYNFTDNFVSETEKEDGTFGRKLIIKFTVTPKAGFLGGNGVYTNASAGVYENGSATDPVLTFDRPAVNVPIPAVTVKAQEKAVYLLNGLTADTLRSGAEVTVGDVTLDLTKADQNFGLEAWQTEYVNITVAIQDKDGKVITSDLSDLTEDQTYTISVTVTPKPVPAGVTPSGEAATEQTNSGNAKISVYKPELTAADSTIYLGETADYAVNFNPETGIKWKHGETVADPETMGKAPELKVSSYNPAAGAFTQDTDVVMTTAIGGSDVTQHTTFVNAKDGHDNNDAGAHQFTVFVKTCSLTVTKAGSGSMTNGTETHIFTVEGPNGISLKVAVQGNGSRTITGLPIGDYTVTEDTNWSWRYEDGKTGSATLEASEAGAHKTVTITNTNPTTTWLSGDSAAINKFAAQPASSAPVQSAPALQADAPAVLPEGPVELSIKE